MEDFDYAFNPTDPMDTTMRETLYEFPEPIDQWAIEDFELFESFMAETE